MSDVADVAKRALALAISRYAADHPAAHERARAWLARLNAAEVPPAQVFIESAAALDELDRIEAAATEDMRLELAHARLSLQSAGSGSFDTAAGPLADFLREVGAQPDLLDIH